MLRSILFKVCKLSCSISGNSLICPSLKTAIFESIPASSALTRSISPSRNAEVSWACFSRTCRFSSKNSEVSVLATCWTFLGFLPA